MKNFLLSMIPTLSYWVLKEKQDRIFHLKEIIQQKEAETKKWHQRSIQSSKEATMLQRNAALNKTQRDQQLEIINNLDEAIKDLTLENKVLQLRLEHK